MIGPNEIFFKSQKSHQRFQNYLAFKKKQVEALRQRVKRRNSKIGSLKGVIESLRNEETSAAAEYLQVIEKVSLTIFFISLRIFTPRDIKFRTILVRKTFS